MSSSPPNMVVALKVPVTSNGYAGFVLRIPMRPVHELGSPGFVLTSSA